MTTTNDFAARATLTVDGKRYDYYSLPALAKTIAPGLAKLPFSLRVVLESLLRNRDGFAVTDEDVKRLATWTAKSSTGSELPFKPARVILQDFTGVPLLVDIAAMRSAVERLGGDPVRINPLVPVDLVIDHSVQVDHFGKADSLARNAKVEFERNHERYEFLRWGQNAVKGLRVVPPATGIVHQVNLEYLASSVLTKDGVAFPDTVVGTDSHTTMINGLGVVGWGVGGIEAEAVMLGQPLYIVTPKVVGVRLTGALRDGVTATDLVLTVTQQLRKHGVVDKFVEFHGPALSTLGIADRATISNMAPEYGATIGFFPVDAATIEYLRRTGRPAHEVALVEAYYRAQGLFRTEESPTPEFDEELALDLSTIEPSLAGPKRPQDRVALAAMQQGFKKALTAPVKDRGFGLAADDATRKVTASIGGKEESLGHGAVVIAAITSCTNTSNPSVMVGAGLVAKKAVERGLTVPPHVKTSLAPGSRVVTEYLREAGVLPALEKIGFSLVGYGCTTCIGNSGPLPDEVAAVVTKENLVAAAVLSGNRNFEGRVHPLVKANYLASPPLVVAYALAGTVDIDLDRDPIGVGKDGKQVYLRDIWPSSAEVASTVERALTPAMFEKVYAEVFAGSDEWKAIAGASAALYAWREASTYIQEPPFFTTLTIDVKPVPAIEGARVLALLGDSITTDHISPAGDIALGTPAARYLEAHGVKKVDFNSYGARRGNDRVMVRGTFSNIRLKNLMVPGVEGGVTIHHPSGERLAIFDAAERYRGEGVPLVILAGKEYGSGSSRDWAAKGTLLLGVRAVIAQSYERIHRANLVGMGVLPLQFREGEGAETYALTGEERFSITVPADVTPRMAVVAKVTRRDGSTIDLPLIARLDTPVDIQYYRNGGILPTVLRQLLAT